jgi:Nuclear pore complex assembly
LLTFHSQDALKLLLEANELEDWTSKILRTFLDYGGYAAGLRFYRAYFATPATPPYSLSLDDAVACVNVLLVNGFVQEAMEFQRSFVSNWEEEGIGRQGRNKKIQYLLYHVFRHSIADSMSLSVLSLLFMSLFHPFSIPFIPFPSLFHPFSILPLT